MVQVSNLDIRGFGGMVVPNTFPRQDELSASLAVLFPGFGYSCDMPLFYYSGLQMLGAGCDVLRVEYAYSREPGFHELPPTLQRDRLLTDSTAALDAAIGMSDYRRIILIGKSIGTRVLGHLMTADVRFHDVESIWLTPLLRDDQLRQQMGGISARSLIVIGTADSHYDRAFIDEIAEHPNFSVISIADGDHSLDLEGDVGASIRALERVMTGIDEFLANGKWHP